MLNEKVALFDMDGTICDYVGAMKAELEKLRAPNEPIIDPFQVGDSLEYQYLWNRMELIKLDENWWASLPKYQLGFDVLEMTKELGYHNEILTQAPKTNPAALSGKLRWIIKHLGKDFDFTMTRNKSRHYGRVLVDDYPGYVVPWLAKRPNGVVIMPKNTYNCDFKYERVIMYDGTNKDEVMQVLTDALER